MENKENKKPGTLLKILFTPLFGRSRFPDPKEQPKPIVSKRFIIYPLLILMLTFFGALAIPQYNQYCCGGTFSKAKSNLHNLYLACKAYWMDSGKDRSCNHEIAQLTTFGYIKSDEVNVFASGKEAEFFAYGAYVRSEKIKVFAMNSLGAIQETTDPQTRAWLQKKAVPKDGPE